MNIILFKIKTYFNKQANGELQAIQESPTGRHLVVIATKFIALSTKINDLHYLLRPKKKRFVSSYPTDRIILPKKKFLGDFYNIFILVQFLQCRRALV